MSCIRFEVRSLDQLHALASAPLPSELGASRATRTLHRDFFLDTTDETLRRQGVTCRLRLSSSDERTLSLRITGAPGEDPVRVDSAVRGTTVAEVMAENTAATRRLRAIVDPATLLARLELEVERLTRTADRDWLRRPRLELHYDRISVRAAVDAPEFHQMCVHARNGSGETAARVAHALAEQHRLAPAVTGTRERAELLARWGKRPDRPERGDSDWLHPVPDPRWAEQPAPELLDPELSLLAFQLRVLSLAEDRNTPLTERLRFLSIVSANVDEFFMVRMDGLKRAAREQREEQADHGLTRAEQLAAIRSRVTEIGARQAACLRDCLVALEAIGVRVRRWGELSPDQRAALRSECEETIQPSLTPLAMTLSPGHPLPHLPHHSLALAVVLRRTGSDRPHLAELELPSDGPRFLAVPGTAHEVVALEEVVRSNLDLLYAGSRVETAFLFRVTRGGDLDLDEAGADDLLEAVADATERRTLNPAVRIEVERGTPDFVRQLLLESLRRDTGATPSELADDDVQEIEGLIDLRSICQLPLPSDPELGYPPVDARDPFPAGRGIFDAIDEEERLVHHPFESFDASVVRFIREAAADPGVTAIKITLYRVGDPSPVAAALLEAARRGKQVAAFVELKARFDEEHNVSWARRLEQAGGRVVYGLIGLKNHAKTALVVRRDPATGRLRRYVHVGTGNYNARSGAQYTDLSLFSSREALTADVADLFNALTGSSAPPRALTRGALVSPHQLVHELLAMIEREAAIARAGRPARITAKFNGLSDVEVVRALHRASCDGVEIDLVVRGICTLRPGVPGRSERVRIVSVVGRFLEHSRIYRFGNDGQPLHFIGSADLRPRNLRRRVELLVPIVEPGHRARLDAILDAYLADETGWELRSTGEYDPRAGSRGAQDIFLEQTTIA